MRLHRVVHGETLSVLSMRFSVPVDAILRLNRHLTNPNLIRTGDELRIPETAARYADILRSLEELRRASERDYRERLAEVADIERDGNTFGAEIDLAADLAGCFLGMGKALLRYGGAVRYAALRKETFSAAEKVIVYAAGQDLNEPGKIELKAIGSADADQYLRIYERVAPVDADRYAAKVGKETAKGATKAIAKSLIRQHIAVEKQSDTELVVMFTIQVAFTGLRKGTDLLGALSPSTLASAYLTHTTGEDLRTTLFRTRQQIDASHTRTMKLLGERIDAIRAERDAAYPGRAPTPAPVVAGRSGML